MPRDLDPRLSDAMLEIIRARHPSWIHQEEIYRYLERSVDFTKKQLELHVQKAGQIEPNWQHDARNLLHTMKRNGTLINPFRNIYGLPLVPESSVTLPKWNSVISKARSISDRYSVSNDNKITELMSNHSIRPSLVEERIRHLINCGGVLELGALHRWRSIEDALIELIDEVSLLETTEHDLPLVVWTPLLNSEKLHEVMSSNQSRRDESLEALGAAVAETPSKKRTVPRDSAGDNSIPFAIDSEGNEVFAGEAKHSGLGHYTCPSCGGQVGRVWPQEPTWMKYYAHKPITTQPSNVDCPYYSGSKNPWLDVKKTFRERLIDSREIAVSVRFGFASSINLRTPLPLNSESISVKSHSGISDSEISALNDWKPFKGDISIRGQNGASDFKIKATVTTEDGDVNCSWKSAGIRPGDLFYAETVDDIKITRVRPSAKYKRSSVFNDLIEGEYLVYVSSQREIDYNPKLKAARDPRKLTGSDGNEILWLHYFEISSSVKWPDTWKIGNLIKDPDAFKVLIASPIDVKPTNPKTVRISDSRPLVLAIKTSEENPQVEAQWWSGKKEWITDELIGDGWSRKNIIPNPDQPVDRLQFQQNNTFAYRPHNPIDISFEQDYVPELNIEKILNYPAVVSIIEGEDELEKINLLSQSKPVEIQSKEFMVSSEWLLVKFAPWKVTYIFTDQATGYVRHGYGIEQLNDRLSRIHGGQKQWQSIFIDWTSQSDRLACIPALQLNYGKQSEPVELEIEDIIEPTQEEPAPRSKLSKGKLPKTIEEISDLADLTPINFAKKFVQLRESNIGELNQWLGDILSCEPGEIDWGMKQRMQEFWLKDKKKYPTISLGCRYQNCVRTHSVTLQNYLDQGDNAGICRGKHRFHRGRGGGGRQSSDRRATAAESRPAPDSNFRRNRRLQRKRRGWR